MKTSFTFLSLFATLILWNNVVSSQVLTPDYAMKFLAGTGDEIQKTYIDKKGNIYISGCFKSEKLEIDKETLVNKSGSDLFLIKIDHELNVIFAKSYNIAFTKISGLVTDNNYNIYLLVNSSVYKLDSMGSMIITNSYSQDSWTSIVIDNADNLYLSGDNYLLKLNSFLQKQWNKLIKGTLLIDKAQNIYLAGYYTDSIRFDNIVLKTISSKENHNIYLAKIDTAGKVLWAKKYCDGEHALLEGAIFDTLSNSIILSGTFKTDTLTFDHLVIRNNGAADLFLAKIDTASNVIMAKSYGGAGSDYCWGITGINSELFAMIGTSNSESIQLGSYVIKGDSTHYSFGDFFIVILDKMGSPVWAQSFPKSSGQSLKSIISDGIKSMYVSGDFCSTSYKSAYNTYSNNPTYINDPSIYLIRLKLETSAIDTLINSFNIFELYPNPTTDFLNIVINSSENAEYEVLTFDGKVSLKNKFHSGINILDTKLLNKGIHIIRINIDGKFYTSKFIKR